MVSSTRAFQNEYDENFFVVALRLFLASISKL